MIFNGARVFTESDDTKFQNPSSQCKTRPPPSLPLDKGMRKNPADSNTCA
jgi:hypothetical protein